MTPTPHPTLAGLLRAVCEQPADDEVRGFLVEWLEENGQSERVEFIRVQCELAKGPPGLRCRKITHCLGGRIDCEPETGQLLPQDGERVSICCEASAGGHEAHWVVASGVMDAPDSIGGIRLREASRLSVWGTDLRRRERELLDAHGCNWLPKLEGEESGTCDGMRVAGADLQLAWRRGFVAEVSCTAEVWCGQECRSCYWRTNEGTVMKWCHDCHGTGRVNAHGPALVQAVPIEKVTLAEWRGESCHACSTGYVPTDRDDSTCEVCHGLYDSRSALAWARQQAGLPALS